MLHLYLYTCIPVPVHLYSMHMAVQCMCSYLYTMSLSSCTATHSYLPRRWLHLRLPHKSHLTLIRRLGFIIFLLKCLPSFIIRVRSTVVSIKPSQLVWGLREVSVDYESIVNLEISQPGGNGNAEAICSGAVGEVLPKSLKNCIAATIVQLHPLSAGLETPELMNLLVCTQAGSSMYAHRNFDKNIHHKRTFTSKEVPRTLQTQSCKLSIVGLLLVVYM